MTRITPIVLAALLATASVACQKKAAPAAPDFTAPLHAYLEERGRLCLGKETWPIDVTERDVAVGSRDAVQMPVLEKLGLVESSNVAGDGTTASVIRYRLTPEGMRYYAPHGKPGEGQRDLCVATLTLDKVVNVAFSKDESGRSTALVSYTYKVDAAPWTRDPDAERAFPMVARVVHGAGSAQLEEAFSQAGTEWVPVEIANRNTASGPLRGAEGRKP